MSLKVNRALRLRIALILLAIVASLVKVPPAWVERFYSRVFYGRLQPVVTSASNQVPFALFDLLVAGAAVLVLVGCVRACRACVKGRTVAPLARALLNLVTTAAIVYLVFLTVWGLNYQREPLTERLAFDRTAVQPGELRRLAAETVRQVNSLHRLAHDNGFPEWAQLPMVLGPAYRETQARLADGARPVPGAPKRTLMTFYFERAGVSGMTDPFFLETLVDRGLLPFERPFVAAHEWAHLAGYASEAEANFIGWLTCVRGDAAAAYSGWLYLYSEIFGALPPADREAYVRALAAGPRDDLRAIAERARRIQPVLQRFSWRIYDRYLKANRVTEGVASYSRALVLVLGTRYDKGWVPVLKDR
jgi:hypothetical protein